MARNVVFNHKGRVGNTTTTLNLAGLLARRGRDPRVIDLDPQGRTSSSTGVSRRVRMRKLISAWSQGPVTRSMVMHSSQASEIRTRTGGHGRLTKPRTGTAISR
jgi:cellulose biosynthesis protein BcsQ